MKVLLLFSNTTVKRGMAFPDDLKNLLEKAAHDKGEDIEFFVSYARSLSYLISNERVKIRDHRNHMDLDEYDFVYFRKAGTAMQQMLTCALYLRDRGVPFWDTEILRANSRNKLSQMIMLERKDLPIPPTLFCRNRSRLVRLVTKTYADIFPFPLIIKATGGSRGDANYLVNDKDELLQRVQQESNRSFMVQAFIPNDGDCRFFIAGGELRGIIGRKGKEGTHLSNTSQGGDAVILPTSDFSDIVKTQALQAAAVFGRDVAGVDIMFDKRNGHHYFLEVNRAPQIEHASFEKEKADWVIDAINDAVIQFQPAPQLADTKAETLVGRFEYVQINDEEGVKFKIIAKTDTGADTSSIHAENIRTDGETIHFEIEGHPVTLDKYFTKNVRSSNGELQERHYVTLPIYIGGKRYMLKTTLSDRSAMKHPMLIGRRFLREHKQMVDVSRRFILSSANKKLKGDEK